MTTDESAPDEVVKKVARAIHEHLLQCNIAQYLNEDDDFTGLATAAIEAHESTLQARVNELRGALKCAASCLAQCASGEATQGDMEIWAEDASQEALATTTPKIEG